MLPRRPATPPASLQRGATVLTLLIILIGCMAVSIGWVYQQMLFGQRAAHHDALKSQAMAAAETGLSWAQAHLNSIRAPEAPCAIQSRVPLPKGLPTRFLACRHDGATWRCQCGPEGSLDHFPESSRPAFAIDLLPSPLERSVRVRSRACARADATCLHNPSAEIQQTWSLMGGLQRLPSGALLALGSVEISGSSANAKQADPLAPLANQPELRHSTEHPQGLPRPQEAAPNTPSPRDEPNSTLFQWMFGFSKAEWQTQPSLLRFNCETGCAQRLARRLADGSVTMVHLPELRIDQPLTLGTPDRPVLLVVDDLAEFNGPTTLYGVLYAGRITSNAPAGTLRIQGALISESDIALGPDPRLNYDAALLQKLQHTTGSYVRVPATWIDP
jgi:hypothetical protein